MRKLKTCLSFLLVMMFLFMFVTYDVVSINTDASDLSDMHFDCDCSDEIISIDPCSLIEDLTMDNLKDNQYLERETAMESDLHTVVYKCADGNYTAYIFQNPVKYVDETGKVRDISTKINTFNENVRGLNSYNLSSSWFNNKYAFSSENNAIKVYYSNRISSSFASIVATENNWIIGLSPIDEKRTVSSSVTLLNSDGEISSNNLKGEQAYDSIKYNCVFNDNVSLYYSTTYTGFKERIEIKSKTDTNKFKFKLFTSGLIPMMKESGGIGLKDEYNNSEIATITPLYVYDSAETPLTTLNNYYEIEKDTIDPDTYIITLNIDNDYLNDNSITYPIIVDPTFTFRSTTAIDDAPVYSGYPNLNHGENYFNCVGYVDSSYETGSLLVKFPSLKNYSFFNNLPDSKINSVTYNVRKVGGGNGNYSATLKAYHYTGSSWSENTVTYNSAAISSHTGSLVDSVNMQLNKWYKFDITSAAIAWKNGSKDYNKGLVIKNATSTTNNTYERALGSVEYGSGVDETYMPYITVVFNNNGTSSGFTSLNLAARNFAQTVYSSSEYVRIEYAAILYSKNGSYYYYNVHSGSPHSASVSTSVPSGATYAGYIHTHPNSEYFSDADRSIADNHGSYAYVVTPSYSLKSYNGVTGVTQTVYTNLYIYPLTNNEKSSLESSLSSVWYGHFEGGVCPKGFGCESKTWPKT